MEKEFVPYDESLALKELGFNEKCFGKYYYVREHEVYDPRKGEDFIFGDNNRIMLRDYPCNYGYDSNEITVCPAPIFSQAFRWLLVLLNKNKYFSNKWTISYNEDYSSLFLGGCNMGVFKTETECLKKLIEISRNGK